MKIICERYYKVFLTDPHYPNHKIFLRIAASTRKKAMAIAMAYRDDLDESRFTEAKRLGYVIHEKGE